MQPLIDFLLEHPYFFVWMTLLNYLLARILVYRLTVRLNRNVYDAMGGRRVQSSLYHKCFNFFSGTVRRYEAKHEKHTYYSRVKAKLNRSGYYGDYAPAVFIAVRYIGTPFAALLAFFANFPGFREALFLLLLSNIMIEMVVASRRKKLNLKFQKYVYKIYKYLHNQVSSGVKVTDAIKTVYEVIDDADLRRILIRLAARYELTLDIDAALDEFRSSFALQEAETLCIALKQGVMTGDNRELLERQEDVMFKKYFNYIQAETDSCRFKSMLAAVMFSAIIVIMVAVPLLRDVADAVGNIFVN